MHRGLLDVMGKGQWTSQEEVEANVALCKGMSFALLGIEG